MTLHDAMRRYLEDRGLFEEQARSIMTELVQSPSMEPVKGRWSDDESGYPPQLKAVLIMALRAHAVEWIDANLPKHWARGVFTDRIESAL